MWRRSRSRFRRLRCGTREISLAEPGSTHLCPEWSIRLDGDAGRSGSRGGAEWTGGIYAARADLAKMPGSFGMSCGYFQDAAAAQPADSAPACSVDLPSRAGDNLFWLGRYIERSENNARSLRCLISRVRQADEVELNCLFRLHWSVDVSGSKLSRRLGRRRGNSKRKSSR